MTTATPSSPPPSSRAGQVVRGTYRLVKLIGKGGMGEVYLAEHVSIPRKFALKFLIGAYAGDAGVLQRFHREATIAASVGSRHIVEVFDFGQTEDGVTFMAMEFLEGESLRAHLDRVGKLSPERWLVLLRQIGAGLHAAHAAGIVHRDLKPDNLFLVRTREGEEVVKILDFGISKIRSEGSSQTQTGAIMGTPHYMSPEQARGVGKEVDARADLFSLGAISYEALSGRLAYNGPSVTAVLMSICLDRPEPLAAVAPDLPGGLVLAVERALARDPEQRFASVQDFVAACTAGLGTEPLPRIERSAAAAGLDQTLLPTGEARPGLVMPAAAGLSGLEATMAPGAPVASVAPASVVPGVSTALDTTLSAATGERGVDPMAATVAPVLSPTSPPGGLTYAPTAPVPAPPPSALRRVLLGLGAVIVVLGLVGLGLFLGGRRPASPRRPAGAPAKVAAKGPPTLVLGITEYAKRDVLDREWNPILESVNRTLAGQAVVRPEYIAYGDIVEATLEGRVDLVVLSEFVYVTSQNRLARERTREFTFLGTKTQNFQNYYRTMLWLRPGHPQAAQVKAPLGRDQAGRLALALGDEKSTSKSAVPRVMIRSWGLRETDFATVTRGLRSHQIAAALAQGTADLGPLNLVDLDGLRRDGKPATGLVEVARSLPIPYDAWVASQAQLRRKLGEPFAAKLEALRSAIGQSRAAILHSDFEATYHAFRLYLGGAFLDPPRPGEPPGDGIRADLAPFDHEILVLRGLTAGAAVDLATFHEDEDRRIMEGYRRIYCRVIGAATVLSGAGTGLRVRPAGAAPAGGWAGVRVLPKGECVRSSP